MRIDTTGIADPHAFYLAQNDPEGAAKTVAGYAPGGERSIVSGWNPPLAQINDLHGPAVESNPGGSVPVAPNTPFDPFYTPFINLIANPQNPFLTASTILVTNTAGFHQHGDQGQVDGL